MNLNPSCLFDGTVVVVTGPVAYRLGPPLERLLREARDRGERLDDDLVNTVRAIEMAGSAYAAARVAASMSALGRITAPTADIGARSAGDIDLLPVPRVADRLNRSDRHVRRLIASGRLAAKRIGRSLVVEAIEVERYLREAS